MQASTQRRARHSACHGPFPLLTSPSFRTPDDVMNTFWLLMSLRGSRAQAEGAWLGVQRDAARGSPLHVLAGGVWQGVRADAHAAAPPRANQQGFCGQTCAGSCSRGLGSAPSTSADPCLHRPCMQERTLRGFALRGSPHLHRPHPLGAGPPTTHLCRILRPWTWFSARHVCTKRSSSAPSGSGCPQRPLRIAARSPGAGRMARGAWRGAHAHHHMWSGVPPHARCAVACSSMRARGTIQPCAPLFDTIATRARRKPAGASCAGSNDC